MPIANILLGLGSALVMLATLVFTAVNWSQMGAALQGAFLLVMTVIAVSCTAWTAHHRMPATAEALGLVAASMTIADAHALRIGFVPGVDARGYWAVALLAVAGLAWLLAEAVDIRSTRFVAVLLAQAAIIPASMIIDTGSGALAASMFLVQVGLVVVWVDRARGVWRPVRVVAGLGAAMLGAFAVLFGLLALAGDGETPVADPTRYAAAGVFLLAAAVLFEVAIVLRRIEWVRLYGLVVGTVLGLGSILTALAVAVPAAWLPVAFSASAVLAVLIALRIDPQWGRAPAAVAGAGAIAGLVGLAEAFGVCIDAAAEAASSGWAWPASTPADQFLLPDVSHPESAVLVANLVVLALGAVAAWPLIGPRWGRRWLVAAGALAMVCVPLLGSGSVHPSVAVAAGTAVAFAVGMAGWALVDGFRGRSALAPAAAAVPMAFLAANWAAASRSVALCVSLAVTAGAALALVGSRRSASRARPGPWDGAATLVAGLAFAVSAMVSAAITTNCLDGGVAASWTVAFLVAALISLVAAQLLPQGAPDAPTGADGPVGVDGQLVVVFDVMAAAAHVVALMVALGDPEALTRALAAGVVVAGITALRRDRRLVAGVAVVEALLLTWLRLDQANIVVIEAYTLPLAAVLLGAGAVAERAAVRRGDELASWITLGPALVVAMGPTVWVGVAEGGTVRPLAGIVGGAVLLVAGAWTRRRAPVDIGVAAIVILGVTRLAPIVADMPNWVTLGLTGLILVAIGARFEQVRRDVGEVRRHYRDLR